MRRVYICVFHVLSGPKNKLTSSVFLQRSIGKDMARITVQDCLAKVGNENRFSLIHLAVKRVRQHRNNQPFLIQCRNKEVVATLREIAAGVINFDNIANFDKPTDAKQTKLIDAEITENSEDTTQAA